MLDGRGQHGHRAGAVHHFAGADVTPAAQALEVLPELIGLLVVVFVVFVVRLWMQGRWLVVWHPNYPPGHAGPLPGCSPLSKVP